MIDRTKVQGQRGRNGSSVSTAWVSPGVSYKNKAPLFSSRCLEKASLEQSTEPSRKTYLCVYKASLYLDGDRRGESENVRNSAGLLGISEQGVTR